MRSYRGGRFNRGGGGGWRGRDGGGRGGRGRYEDAGPPENVTELGDFTHPCLEQIVCKCTTEKVPYFNAPVFFENKTQLGKIDEIFGGLRNHYVSITVADGFKATSFTVGTKIYIDPYKLMPLERFLPGAPQSRGRGGRGGRSFRGGPSDRGRGGRGFRDRGGNFGGRGHRGDSFGGRGNRGDNFGGRGRRGDNFGGRSHRGGREGFGYDRGSRKSPFENTAPREEEDSDLKV